MVSIKILCSDPSESKGPSSIFHLFNVDVTHTFEAIFLMVLTAKYPVCYAERGLGNSVITGLDICGEVSSVEVTNNTELLEAYSVHFKQMSKIVFNLKPEDVAKSDKITVGPQHGKLYNMFCSPSVKLEQEVEVSKNKRQKLAGTCEPFTRQEIRKAKCITSPTPNVDLAWEAIRMFLVQVLGFTCAEDARSNPNHLMYDFIEDFSLLLLQISNRWNKIYEGMSKLQQQSISKSKVLLQLFFKDVDGKILREVNRSAKTKRSTYGQEDCSHILLAFNKLLDDQRYEVIFTIVSTDLRSELTEVRCAVHSRHAFLVSEQLRVSALRRENQKHMSRTGVQVLQEHGALEVICIGGGIEFDETVIRPCHDEITSLTKNLEFWEFISLEAIEPEDKASRYKFYDVAKRGFHLGKGLYFMLLKSTPNVRTQRNIYFILKLPISDKLEIFQQMKVYKDVYSKIKDSVPQIVSRQQKQYIRDCIKESVGGTAMKRRLLEQMLLPRDESGSCNSMEEASDKVEVLMNGGIIDDTSIIDLRKFNGHNCQYEQFYNIVHAILESNEKHASESRHGEDLIDPNQISSIADLHRQAVVIANAQNNEIPIVESSCLITVENVDCKDSKIMRMQRDSAYSKQIYIKFNLFEEVEFHAHVNASLSTLAPGALIDLLKIHQFQIDPSKEIKVNMHIHFNDRVSSIENGIRVVHSDWGHKFENTCFDGDMSMNSVTSVDSLRLREYHRCLFLHLAIPLNINPVVLLFVFGLIMSYRLRTNLKNLDVDEKAKYNDLFVKNSFTDFEILHPCYVDEMRRFDIIILGTVVTKETMRVDCSNITVVSDPSFLDPKETIILCYNGHAHFVRLKAENGDCKNLGERILAGARLKGTMIVDKNIDPNFSVIEFGKRSIAAIINLIEVAVTDLSSSMGAHGTVIFPPSTTSVQIGIPTLSHFRMQFLPNSVTRNSASKYVGRFGYKVTKQRNCIHLDHPHFNFNEANSKYMHQWMVDWHNSLCNDPAEPFGICYIETDDKNKVNLCEKGYVLAASQNASKVLTLAGGKNSSKDKALSDHNAGGSKSKLIPTVYLVSDLNKYQDPVFNSLYHGSMILNVKDSITTPSTALTAGLNLAKVVRTYGNNAAMVVVKTDGGPEHNFEHASVYTAKAAMFFYLDLDFLALVKSCPKNSWVNCVERCMSLLNLALVGAVLTRPHLCDKTGVECPVLEQKFTACQTQDEIRKKSASDPAFFQALQGSLDKAATALEERFQRKVTFDEKPIVIAEKGDKAEQDCFLDALKYVNINLPHVIKTSPKGLSDSSIPALMKDLMNSNHCKRTTYTLQFVKFCWVEVVKAAVRRGEDPNNLSDSACEHCPFKCRKPKISLEKWASFSFVCTPLTVDPQDPKSDFLHLHDAQKAVASGSRVDEEILPAVLTVNQKTSWGIPPKNTIGKEMNKSDILSKQHLRGTIPCSDCGKIRGVFTTKILVKTNPQIKKLEEYLLTAWHSSFKCGDDLTTSAKDFGIADDFLPYTRLTSGVTVLNCTTRIEDLLYNFSECQNICNVCGSKTAIVTEGSSHKPLCKNCSENGWPQTIFDKESKNKFETSKKLKSEKEKEKSAKNLVLKANMYFTVKAAEATGNSPVVSDSSSWMQQGSAVASGAKVGSVSSSQMQQSSEESPEVGPILAPCPGVLTGQIVSNIIGSSEHMKISVSSNCSSSFCVRLVDTLTKMSTSAERLAYLESTKMFSIFIKKSLQGPYNGNAPDGFCQYTSSAATYFGRTINLVKEEDKELFRNFYTEILPNLIGPERMDRKMMNDNNIVGRPHTMRLLLQAVLNALNYYPNKLPEALWGGTTFIENGSFLLGAIDERTTCHVAYWSTNPFDKKGSAGLNQLEHLIGPTASVGNEGSTEKYFNGRFIFSINNVRGGCTDKMRNLTFDKDHYFPCSHNKRELSADFLLDQTQIAWNDWFRQQEMYFNTDATTAVIPSIRGVETKSTSVSRNVPDCTHKVEINDDVTHDAIGTIAPVPVSVEKRSQITKLSGYSFNSTTNTSSVVGAIAGGKFNSALKVMAFHTENASVAIAEFSEQSFSELKCNDIEYSAPFSRILASNNSSLSTIKNKRKR